MIQDPAHIRAAADLADADFVAALSAGRWRVVEFAFPSLDFAITATEPDGTKSEYWFHADLSNYPAQAPMVRIWDPATNGPLPQNRRPKGDQRVMTSFQTWGSDTVYRPWERLTGPHNGAGAAQSHLAWTPARKLTFIFEDLHGLLNSNARAHRIRAAA